MLDVSAAPGEMESRRTVVVSGVPAALPAGRMADKLTIHFQSRRRSDGGDVEELKYPTNMDGVAFVTFDRAEDAVKVTRKKQQILTDSEFPQQYVLTVFPFSTDVFVYVAGATVDLSTFGSDPASLIKSLQSAHRSLRFQPLLPGKVSIEGPFSAVQALRADLIHRDGQLKSTNSAIRLTETAANPRLISHHRPVGSVSRSASKAEREAATSSSLSAALQSTGEASEVQSLLCKAKSPNASSRRKVCDGSLDADGEEPRGRLGSNMSSEYRREGTKANARQVVGAEIGAGIISALSGPDRLPGEQKSANKPQQHLRADGGQNHLGSGGSAKSFHNTSKDVSAPWKSRADLTGVRPEPPEDIWVDSDMFRYVVKFHREDLKSRLNGVKMSIKRFEGAGLTRISLSRNQTNTSSIQKASESLKSLMESCFLTLRVDKIFYDDKQKVTQICDEVNSLHKDVLHVFEDCFIKVIGPSSSIHSFCKRVEETLRR